MKVDITKEERQAIINMMEGSTIPMAKAKEALALLKKFKEAKE